MWYHLKSENHKIAVHLNTFAIKPIEDIKKAILQYKMGMKFLKRTFNSDSSSSTNTTSTIENNNDLEENNTISIEKIKHKTDVYARNLAHRVERYEKTKSIEKLVNTIKNSTKRLTNLQKDKYYYLLNKYPENESLLSIKHLVPPLTITYVKEQKPIKQKPIKQSKKKQKQDIIHNNDNNISYPIIKYEDKTQNNNNISYPIIKYEHTTQNNKQNISKPVYEIVQYVQ
jgi:hypothetical protein